METKMYNNMTLQEVVRNDLKQAITNYDYIKKNFLRVVVGEMDRVGKDLPDEKVLSILKKMKQNAIDLGDKDEIRMLGAYLPQELGDDEIEIIVSDIIMGGGYTQSGDIGKFMKDILAHEKSALINKKTAKEFFLKKV